MKDFEQFTAEIVARFPQGSELSVRDVIRVLCWHTPADCEPLVVNGQPQEPEHTSLDDEYPYLLVMDRGERSLHDACAKERIAGYKVDTIIEAFRSILGCVEVLHASGVIHGDLKQRNILRFIVDDLAKWILCDMDASALRGRTIGRKTSSAYAPPELARHKYAGDKSGVLDDPTLCTAAPSHAVTVVGQTKDYFVIKNSWGTTCECIRLS